jgi:methionyl-tRNA formyltransferase
MKILWLSANKLGYELVKEAVDLNQDLSIITLNEQARTVMYDGIDHKQWHELGIPVYEIERINQAEDLIKNIQPDLIIMCGWRQIVDKTIIDIPKYGFIGFHPTLLPKGRGPAPIINSILHGFEKSGLSMFYVSPGLDDGDIIGQQPFQILPTDHANDVYEKVISAGKLLIKKYLPMLIVGTAPRIPQDHSQATIFPKLSLKDNEINLDDQTEYNLRKIRALSTPYLGAYIKKGRNKLRIWNASVDKEVAVMGVVYPGVEKYLPEYFDSLEKQTDSDFDLIIFNTGINIDELKTSLRIKEIHLPQITIALQRQWAIKKIKEMGYKYLIFSDCDDYFSPNRVEESVRLLQDKQIVFNDLNLVDETGKLIHKSVLRTNLINENSTEKLLDLNFLGFTHTAVRISDVKMFDFPEKLVSVDWYFFSVLIFYQDFSVGFIDKPLSSYRRYGNNLGFVLKVDEGYMRRCFMVKSLHYDGLLNHNKYKAKFREKILQRSENLNLLRTKLNDLTSLQNYIVERNKGDKISPLLWQEV